MILKTAVFATHAHSKQRRKFDGSPYINHLLRVGEKAAIGKLSEDAVAAGILHDILEDTKTTLEELQRNVSPRTVQLVQLLTKWWPEDSSEEVIRSGKIEYYAKILGDQDAIELKLLDRADNILDAAHLIDASSVAWAKSYLKETEDEFPPLLAKSKNDFVRSTFLQSLNAVTAALSKK